MKLINQSLCCVALLLSASLCAKASSRIVSCGMPSVTPVTTLKYAAGDAVATAPAPLMSRSEDASVPEGDEKVYVTNWMQLFGDAVVDNTGLAHRVRFADDGKVYFHDFFAVGYDTWIEGTLDDKGVITVPTHQKVASIELIPGYDIDVTLESSTFEISETSMTSNIDMEAENITLLLKEDGSIVSPDMDKEWTERCYPVAYARNKVYALCGAINMVPSPFVLPEPPTGLAQEEYSYTYRLEDIFTKATVVKVMFDKEDVYLQGLCPSLPEIWLKGTLNADNTKLVLKSGQYMGFEQYHHSFAAAHKNPNASADNPGEPNWLTDDELVLNVDLDGKTFYFDSKYVFSVTINGDVSYTLNAVKLKPRDDASIGKPMQPVITTGSELLWLEADFLPFVQPNADVDGNYIDTANLTWRMYYDDVLFTFTPAEYQNIATATDEIPYCFDDRWDFIVYTDVMEQCVAIYGAGYKNIGIESVYRSGDKMTVSDRSYFGEKPSSAVDNVIASEVVSSEYFDISGRKVLHPSDGLYIRVDRLADGSTTRNKVIIR